MRFGTLCALAALTALSVRLSAQSNSISVTAPGPLAITTAVAGSQPTPQTDNTARYTVSVVSGRKKITAELDTPLPAGVTLTISLSAPSGAVSVGNVALDTSPRDVVRYIAIGSYAGLSVTIALASSVNAGVIPYNANHVVLTLADDP